VCGEVVFEYRPPSASAGCGGVGVCGGVERGRGGDGGIG